MTNPFYVASGTPATSSFGASQPMRSEFQAIQGGFEKFPDFTGSAPGTFLINNFTATGITTAPGMVISPDGSLGIGTGPSPPTFFLDILRSQNSSLAVMLRNPNAGVSTSAGYRLDNGTNTAAITLTGINYTPTVFYDRQDTLAINSKGAGGMSFAVSGASGTGDFRFYSGNSDASAIERMRIDASGNVGIGMIPSQALDITKDVNTGVFASIANPNAGGLARIGLRLTNGLRSAYLFQYGNNWTGGGTLNVPGCTQLYSDATAGLVIHAGQAPVILGTNDTERMRIETNGNVGIGKTPSVKLDILQSQNNMSYIILTNNNPGGTAAGSSIVVSNGANTGNLEHYGLNYVPTLVYRANGTALVGTGSGGLTLVTSTPQPIYFAINNIERMRIDTAGHVGINIANPTDLLHIQTDATHPDSIMIQTASDSANAIVRFRDISPGQGRYVGLSFLNNAGVPRGQVVYGSVNNAGASDAMLFLTAGVERMRITASGHVGIGTTAPLSIGAEFTVLDVMGTSAGRTGALLLRSNDNSHNFNLYGTYGSFYLGTATAQPLLIMTNNTEQMRINTSGVVKCPNGYNSASGVTPPLANNVPYAIFNTGSEGTWLVSVFMNFGTSNYSAFAIISSDNVDARFHFINNGTLMAITLSGYSISVTQSSGVDGQYVNWAILRIFPGN